MSAAKNCKLNFLHKTIHTLSIGKTAS